MQLLIVGFFHWLILILIIKPVVNFHNNPVGYICVLLLRAIVSVEPASNCKISENGLSADCSNKVNTIPNDLDPKLSSLDLSHNTFIELRENSFKKYDNLTKLVIKHVKMDISKVDLYLFRPLKKLKVLDLSQSDFTEKAYFYFPGSLTVLYINELRVKDVDVSQLKYLKEFHAKGNQLLELPIMHKLAPISIIDLESNLLENLTPEKLAPFCLLKTLNVKLDPRARLIASPARYCICERVNLWTHSFKIEGEKLQCNTSSYKYTCEETFSDSTLSVFNECLERFEKSGSHFFLYIVIIVSLLVAISALGYLGYYYYTTKIKSNTTVLDQTEQGNEYSSPSSAKRESSKVEQEEVEY